MRPARGSDIDETPQGVRGQVGSAGATVVEEAGSHSIYASQPRAVADLIAQAARNVVAEVSTA